MLSGELCADRGNTASRRPPSRCGASVQYRHLWGGPLGVHGLWGVLGEREVPEVCAGMRVGRLGPSPSRMSFDARPVESLSARGALRKECSSREDSSMKRALSALMVRGRRYTGLRNSERKEICSGVRGSEGRGGADGEG